MLSDKPFRKEDLDLYLKELAKEFRKQNGKAIPAEITLIGGASILINYGFREMTYDMDAIMDAASSMSEINTPVVLSGDSALAGRNKRIALRYGFRV